MIVSIICINLGRCKFLWQCAFHLYLQTKNLSKHMKFLRKLVSGEYSLGKTYWLYGVLFNMILATVVIISTSTYSSSSTSKALPFLACFSFLLIYNMIFSIGLWNSSTNHVGSAIWKFIAKLIAIINFVFTGLFILFLGSQFLIRLFD